MPSIFDEVMELKRPQLDDDKKVERVKATFRGIPENKKSKAWEYALEEDADGSRILSFMVDEGVVNFKLNPEPTDDGYQAIRIPDVERDDFGTRGNAVRGRMQIHRSGPNIIHGTIQNKGKAMTFALENESPEENNWKVRAKQDPTKDVATLIQSVSPSTKIASFVRRDPNLHNWSLPLTADYPQAMLLSALIGAGAMGTYNLGRKALKKVQGEEDDGRALWQDIILGGAGGALASGAFKYFGETDKHLGRRAPRYNHRRPDSVPLVFPDMRTQTKVVVDPAFVQPYQKGASMSKEANDLDISRIQNLLSFDHSLTPADRKILMSQLQQAMRMSSNGKIDINRVRNAGLGMLAGYISAKALGFGVPMQIGAAALGGFMAGRPSGNNARKWDTRGFYHY
jgi:hypothetical protein